MMTTNGLFLKRTSHKKASQFAIEKYDIGNINAAAFDEDLLIKATLQSQKQNILREVMRVIGKRQVTVGELHFAPQWLLDKATTKELNANWNGAYEKILSSTIPPDANIMSSRLVFKIKEDETGELKFEGRLVLHGNRNKDRFLVRRDSASADLCIVLIILSLAQILGFLIATADVKEAYIQSGSITREIFVRPPPTLI